MLYVYIHGCMYEHPYVCPCMFSVCVCAHTCESLSQLRPSHWPDGHHGFEALCVRKLGGFSLKRKTGEILPYAASECGPLSLTVGHTPCCCQNWFITLCSPFYDRIAATQSYEFKHFKE